MKTRLLEKLFTAICVRLMPIGVMGEAAGL
jgi:hypothetical protein